MSHADKISLLRRDRLQLLEDAAEYRRKAAEGRAAGEPKTDTERYERLADDRERLAQQKQDDINGLSQLPLF